MAVAAIGAAFNPLTIQVLVEFGIQNPLRQCLLEVVKQAVLRKHFIRIAAGKQLVQKFFLDRHVMILLFPSSWPHAQNSRQSHARCSPISQASSPGRGCLPLSHIRWGGPSAVRTRTAANRALSRPLVPLRQLTVLHCALANMSSAAVDRLSGTCRLRGRPRTLVTGQMSCTPTGYTLR